MDADPLPSLSFLAVDASTTTLTFAVLGILLAGSAIASASEVAFFGLTPGEKDELERQPLLATLLIWNNLFNLGFVLVWGLWIGQALSEGGTSWVRAFWETGVATIILLIVGEVVPKSVANQKRVTVSQRMASAL